MRNIFLQIAILIVITASTGVFAQRSASSVSTGVNKEFMPLGEVREGMRGTARTVFRGTEPEEFNVEILGVVPGGIGPKQDLIIGRLSGGPADRTGVFAGMSGSPVYVGGKLVGAISYSFPFSKEPICGITPIEQMLSIFEKKAPGRTAQNVVRKYSFSELASTGSQNSLPNSLSADSGLISSVSPNSMLMAVAGQSFRPIATPITFSGFSQVTLDKFAPQLLQAGLLPVNATGGTSAITPMKKAEPNTLLGGRSVSMHLARGDYGLAAAGTVTFRDGEKVYAFGHPFLGLGTSDLAMSESHVVTVVPSVNNSFKLAVADSLVGSMTQDRATGVFGSLGSSPKMIPVRLALTTSRGQSQVLNFEIARDETLTPILLNITIYNALISQERSIGDSTISINGAITLKNQKAVKVLRRFGGSQALQLAAGAVAIPVNALLRGQFDDLDFDRIDVDLKIDDGSDSAMLERLAIDRNQVRAGDTVELQAFARTTSGSVFVERIPLTIDAGLAPGIYSVMVGDGAAIQRNEAVQQFVPKDLGELIDTINKVRLQDRLYAKLFRTSSGLVIGTSEMPNLPPSVLATMNNDRMSGGTKPSLQSVIKVSDIPPAKFVITGEQTLTFEVVK
jgi:hypothetical protein